jgi:hypothetical protein
LVTLSEDCLKAAPENHTLRLLREFREEFREFGVMTDKSFAQIQERFNSLQQTHARRKRSRPPCDAESEERISALEQTFPLLSDAD